MGTIFFCICCLGACASCTALFVTKTWSLEDNFIWYGVTTERYI
jgi:hypothetical protein